ncbi:MAG: ribonuclease domain-containing protein [Planktothrix rubescens PR222]
MSFLRKGLIFFLTFLVCFTVTITYHFNFSPVSATEITIVAQAPTVNLSQLPPEARNTLKLIDQGGPFPYPEKDGSTFFNQEKLLPYKPKGYYREYTIPTPGIGHRGARRFVVGSQGEIYYTSDHYQSFLRVLRQ